MRCVCVFTWFCKTLLTLTRPTSLSLCVEGDFKLPERFWGLRLARFQISYLKLFSIFSLLPLNWTGRRQALSGGAPFLSPPLIGRGEGPGYQRGPFGLVFLLCVSLARPALAGGVDVRGSIQVSPLEWNKFRCQAPARLHSSQQGHGASDGNQAPACISIMPPRTMHNS